MVNKLISGITLAVIAIGAGYGLIRFQDQSAMAQATAFSIESIGNTNGNTNTTAPTWGLCMVAAVTARDTAITAAWNTYADSVGTAYSNRLPALAKAWMINVKKTRHDAIKQAWTDFKLARKTARKAFNNTKANSWKQFGKDQKVCKAPADLQGTGVDSQPTHAD